MTDHNFISTTECDTVHTPHELIEAQAVDMALLAMNERLPDMADGELDRLMDVAAEVTQAVLKLAHVPDNWLGFLERVPRDRLPLLRAQIASIVYDQIPNRPGPLSARRREALEQIRALVPKEHHKTLYRLILDYESADWEHLIADTDNAFALGYALGRDPSAFFFEQGAADDK